MTQSNFSAQVSAFVASTKERLDAVFKESAERIIETMQEPGPTIASTKIQIAKGLGTRGRGKNKRPIQGPVMVTSGSGHMPVDTNRLRASLQISFDAPLPMRVEAKPKDGATYSTPDVAAMIENAPMGGTIYATYGANYARAVNYGFRSFPGYQFVGLAAQKWPAIVEQVCAELQSRASP